MSVAIISFSPEDLEAYQEPDDPADAAKDLQDALDELRAYGDQPDAWTNWEDFEAELDRAEDAGELPC